MFCTLEAKEVYHDVQLSSEMFDVSEEDYDDGDGENVLDIVEF